MSRRGSCWHKLTQNFPIIRYWKFDITCSSFTPWLLHHREWTSEHLYLAPTNAFDNSTSDKWKDTFLKINSFTFLLSAMQSPPCKNLRIMTFTKHEQFDSEKTNQLISCFLFVAWRRSLRHELRKRMTFSWKAVACVLIIVEAQSKLYWWFVIVSQRHILHVSVSHGTRNRFNHQYSLLFCF